MGARQLRADPEVLLDRVGLRDEVATVGVAKAGTSAEVVVTVSPRTGAVKAASRTRNPAQVDVLLGD